MLSGRDAESERIRSCAGICDTRVRYSLGLPGMVEVRQHPDPVGGHAGDSQVVDGHEEPMPPPTVTNGTSTTGMPARASFSSVQTSAAAQLVGQVAVTRRCLGRWCRDRPRSPRNTGRFPPSLD